MQLRHLQLVRTSLELCTCLVPLPQSLVSSGSMRKHGSQDIVLVTNHEILPQLLLVPPRLAGHVQGMEDPHRLHPTLPQLSSRQGVA